VVSSWARQPWKLGRSRLSFLLAVSAADFSSTAQALRFVRAENGNRPGEFVIVGGVLELDMSKASATTRRQGDAERRVA
jgi:hypothetical protein